MNEILRCESVTKRFGSLAAVDDVTLSIERGARHALIGPNGAGKSTFFNMIAGTLTPTRGQIVFDGRDITTKSDAWRSRAGLAKTFQHASLFLTLSVADNVAIAAQRVTGDGTRLLRSTRRLRDVDETVGETLARTGLSGSESRQVGSLSHGERRQLEVAVALATNPRLLLLDEPTAGMSAAETTRFAELVESLPADVTVLLIEHDLDVVFRLASRISVLHLGGLLADGEPEQIRGDEAVQRAYLGDAREEELFFPGGGRVSGELVTTGLRAGYAGSNVLDGVDLTVGKGEVVGLLGRNGVGKSTLISTLMGWVRPTAGSIQLDGQELAGMPTHKIARSGVAVVPQGRRVFAPLTVHNNLRIAARGSQRWPVERVYEVMPRLAERRRNRGDQLSGGEQQMLAIGRALVLDPRLLLLDEPSDGLAPAVVEQVMEIVIGLRSEGLSVLLVEQDLRAAFSAADRILVMQKGRIVHNSTTQEFRSDGERGRRLLGVG